jgi:hypothetical protein
MGQRFFQSTMPKIADELERLNKRIGEAMGIPKHLLEKKSAPWPPPSGHVGFDDVERSAKLATMIENKKTLGSILAGLRLLQQQITGEKHDVTEIANCAGEVEPLTAEEIDGLCEDLNFL